MAAVIAGLLALLMRFARRIHRDPGVRVEMASRPVRTAADWAREASEHEASGAWRQALRCRYRALVSELAARRVVDEVPGRTAREYQAIVDRRLPPAGAPFAAASALFEDAWYGHRSSTGDDHHRFTELAAAVLAAEALVEANPR